MASTILIESLEMLRRRVRGLAILFGAGLVLTAAVALLVATVLVDYLLNLPAVPRVLLIYLAAATVVYALWHWVIKSWLAKLTLTDVAGRVEQTYPQFQDRLRSTVDILTGVELPGSEIMKQRVVSEATRLTQSLDLTRVVVARPVWYSTAAGASAVLILAVLLGTMGPQYSRIALDRLLSPFQSHPWPKLVTIEQVGSLPDHAAVGQRLDVAIRLSLGDRASRKAIIHYSYGDAGGKQFTTDEQELMTRGDDGVYHASVDARTPADANSGQIHIWTESGDDRFDLAPIKVVQRLGIVGVQAVITAPAYAMLPSAAVNLSQNPATVTLGSKILLTATFNKPLQAGVPVTVESLTPKSTAIFHWNAPMGNTITASMDATDSVRFHLHATDIDGLKNTAAEEYELVVRPDQNPTVVIENPRRNEDRTPRAVIPLQAAAEDDFGITSLVLMIDRIGDKKHWEIPLVQNAQAVAGVAWQRVDGNADLQRFRANYSWDLAALANAQKDSQLKPGDVLEYYAVVKDNFILNNVTHAPVPSGKLRITVISQDELTNKIVDQLNTVAEQVTTIKQTQTSTQKQTSGLAHEVLGKPALDDADKAAADRLSAQQSTIASQTKSIATKLAEIQQQMDENKSTNSDLKETARDVGNLLNSAAENPMKNAAGNINDSKQDKSKDDRDQKLADAQGDQAKANDTLQKALDRMGNIGSLSRSIESVRAILAEQQALSARTAELGKSNLGKTPEEMSPQDRDKLNELAKAQAELGNRTAKAVDEMNKNAEKLTKSDPAASKAMSQAADTAQQQNVPGNQQKASTATSANQQSQAQSAQKQAELGLQMMLANLREAEKHKLDELARKLAELQQQVAILIRRQSGHNLDNLTLQGNDALAEVSAATRNDLFTLSERDPNHLPPSIDLGMLSSAQEQTQQNARDIAKTAEDMPDGGDPADHITQAADKMERAIVNLRASKLVDAYNPAQVDALSALLQAKKLIDQQKKKADDKQQDQKKESIRQAFMAIRAHQDEVDAKTVAVDSSPRNDDGSLRREEAVRLGQLPGQQGKVSDEAQKLDEPLAGLGSIVYTWANRDIVKNMKQVKDLLGKPQTDAITQTQQTQIIAELDAMIRDLATKPEESKFNQHHQGGGGGSGGGSSGMPTEAEFRLMKDFQIAENNATVVISKQPKSAKSDLLALGERQGDLRNLLDQLIQKASKGQSKLPPEPDNRDQLPEEAGDAGKAQEAVDNKELENDLIGDGKPSKPADAQNADAQHDLNLVGNRMARSRQRLAINSDPGAVTQEIQKRILDNLDDLIEEARKKEAQAQNQPPKPGGDPQQASKPKPADGPPQQAKGKQQQNSGQSPATSADPGGGSATDPSGDLARQEARMWGNVTPRDRQAVIESKGEKVLDKYKDLVDDYYRTLSTKAKQ